MTANIQVHKLNESFFRVDCEPHIQKELQKEFSYLNPDAEHVARAKKIKGWDGRMKLYKLHDRKLYVGFLDRLLKFSEQNGYAVKCHFTRFEEPSDNYSSLIHSYARKYGMPFELYDFQVRTLNHCLHNDRAIILSPTGSGKSAMIYMLCKFHTMGEKSKPVLIIDPTIGLVNQMKSDFEEYGCNPENVQTIMEGQTKEITCPIVISTWQSLQYESEEFFNQFSVLIADEVHLFTGKQLTGIIERCTKVPFKYGFSGTLEESKMAELVLEGLFGPIYEAATIRELIELGVLCDFEIKSTVLIHPPYNCKLAYRMNYPEEMEYLCMNEERNEFILNLADMLDGNTLILFQYIEKHGDILLDMIQNRSRKKPFYYISGRVDHKLREQYRQELNAKDDNDILASFQTFSFGINVKSIRNIILASPTKSRIRLLQTIGRMLRLHENKDMAYLYDIGDKLTWKIKDNITLGHFVSRIELFDREGFNHTTMNYHLKKDQPWVI